MIVDDKHYKKFILYEDPSIVEYRTDIKGWVGSNNKRYYGDMEDSEHLARYDSCTHKRCKCGNLMRKHFTLCKVCREKKEKERYYKRPYKIYKPDMVVYSDLYDEYFFDYDEIMDYYEYNDINITDDLRLIICEPNKPYNIDPYDIYEDILPDDSNIDLPDEILEAFDRLNDTLNKCKSIISWEPGKHRTDIR
jgi:hypothetical protein